MSIAQAQIDVTGSKPDDNGLEQTDCPFHSGAGSTLLLDHLRGACICFVCRAMGTMQVEIVAGKRLAIVELQRYRTQLATVLPEPLALGGPSKKAMANLQYLPQPEALSRASLHDAAQLLPGVPVQLMCSPDDIDHALVGWLTVKWPQLCIVFVPDPILRNRGWALASRKGVVVSARVGQ